MPRSVKSSNLNGNSSNGRRQQPKAREAVAGDETSTRGINNRSTSEAKSAGYPICQKTRRVNRTRSDDTVVPTDTDDTSSPPPLQHKRRKLDNQAGLKNIQAVEESTEDDSYNDSDSYYSDSYYSDSYDDDGDDYDYDYDDVFSGEDFSDVGGNSDDDEDDDAESQIRPIAPEVLEAVQGLEQNATNKAIDADSPKWADMGFFDLLEYLVYSGNGFSRGDFEKDDQNWRKINEHVSQDTIMKDLQRPGLSTQQCYRTYFKLWAEFCNQRHKDSESELMVSETEEPDSHGDERRLDEEHPYEVTIKKVLAFFKDVLFKKPTIKRLYLHKDYSYPFATYRDISEKDPRAVIVRGTGKARNSRYVVDLKKVVDELTEHEEGHYRYKKLQVCLGVRSIYQARSALAFLLKRQSMRLNEEERNLTPPLLHSNYIGQAIENYNRQLVYGTILAPNDDPVRLAYTPEEHLRMLLQTFLSETPALSPQKLKIQIREHAKIAMRHMLLLQDQDLRSLAQCNSYLTHVHLDRNNTIAVQPLWVLQLRFWENIPDLEFIRVQQVAAVRHVDVRRCAVGAYAFHLFYLFKDYGKDIGDYFRLPRWADYKAFPTDTGKFENEQSYANARDSFNKVKLKVNVRCAKVSHAGRYSGYAEAQEIGISLADIQQADGMFSGKTYLNSYQSNEPYVFARGMAGFLRKPFYLARNDVDLNVAEHGNLMRMIFPFIEDALYVKEKEPGEYERWIEAISREMNDMDGMDFLFQTITPSHDIRDSGRADIYEYAEPFLLMLARFRRVILQDVIEYLYLMERNGKTTWANWHIPLFNHLSHIFNRPDFIALKKTLFVRFEQADGRWSESPPEPPVHLSPADAKYIQDILDADRRQFEASMRMMEAEVEELTSKVAEMVSPLVTDVASMVRTMMETTMNLRNCESQLSLLQSHLTGSHFLQPNPTSTTPATTSTLQVQPCTQPLAQTAPSIATVARESPPFLSARSTFNYHPANHLLTVKKIIAEQAMYDSRTYQSGPVPMNVTKIISLRRPVAVYAYFLARTMFKSSQKEVDEAALATDNSGTHAVFDYLQNKRDSECKNWAQFFEWCHERLQREGREAGDEDTIRYLDKRQSIANMRAAKRAKKA
ncbi:hypothetical protein BGW42_006695 [Actinomortierella wolfii]|nr:hypothetical protein BGW42_006695 [Actinomortierella wolfii]